jgi:hypothetical protein
VRASPLPVWERVPLRLRRGAGEGFQGERKIPHPPVYCFTKYVKVTFFPGASPSPFRAAASEHKQVRPLDIYEDQLDEAQLAV